MIEATANLAKKQSLGAAVQAWRKAAGLSRTAFARSVGTSRQNITNLEEERISQPDYLLGLARAMGTTVEALARGQYPDAALHHSEKPDANSLTIANMAGSVRRRASDPPDVGVFKVPLLSTVPPGIPPAQLLAQLPPDAPALAAATDMGPSAFAVQMTDDSMANANGAPSLPAGTYVLCRADLLPAKPGAIVAVGYASQAVEVRRLASVGGVLSLVPLNPRYPVLPLSDDAQVLGVAVRAEISLG
jgi:SOS-response transcriptional repressor LexA